MAATKVLLITDLEKVGRSGDIVSVKPGFARNWLLPKQFAVRADKRAINMQERLLEERRLKAAEDKKGSEAVAKVLEGKEFSTSVKVDPEGHMYGSVTTLDIVNLVNEQKKVTLDRHDINLKQPIKKVGTYSITAKLKEGVTATFSITVTPELEDATGVVAENTEEE